MPLYSLAAYPPTLPNFWGGTEVTVENNLIESGTSLGPPTQRSGRALHPRLLQIRWRFTRAEYLQFRAWWKTTLKNGVLPFSGVFTLYGEAGEFYLQFTSKPSFAAINSEWSVSVQAWCWKAPEMSEEEAIGAVIDLASVESLVNGFESIMSTYYDLGASA